MEELLEVSCCEGVAVPLGVGATLGVALPVTLGVEPELPVRVELWLGVAVRVAVPDPEGLRVAVREPELLRAAVPLGVRADEPVAAWLCVEDWLALLDADAVAEPLRELV